MIPAKKRRTEHIFCSHCNSYLTDKLFKDHKRLYYSPTTKRWIQENEFQDDSDELPSLPDSSASDSDGIAESPPDSPTKSPPSPLSFFDVEEELPRTDFGSCARPASPVTDANEQG